MQRPAARLPPVNVWVAILRILFPQFRSLSVYLGRIRQAEQGWHDKLAGTVVVRARRAGQSCHVRASLTLCRTDGPLSPRDRRAPCWPAVHNDVRPLCETGPCVRPTANNLTRGERHSQLCLCRDGDSACGVEIEEITPNRLNSTATFWIACTAALQSAAYISIGRVFDRKSPYNLLDSVDGRDGKEPLLL